MKIHTTNNKQETKKIGAPYFSPEVGIKIYNQLNIRFVKQMETWRDSAY